MVHGSVEVLGRVNGFIPTLLCTKEDGVVVVSSHQGPIQTTRLNDLLSIPKSGSVACSIQSVLGVNQNLSSHIDTTTSSIVSTFRKERHMEVARGAYSVSSEEVSWSNSHSQDISKSCGGLVLSGVSIGDYCIQTSNNRFWVLQR